MIHDIFSETQKIWNKRLKECVERNGSQAAFANALNDKYRTYDEKQFRQPTVSNWWNVGARRDDKATIGFPKFENMLMIADCLGVDIGYLIGETDSETFTLGKVSEYLHLESDALKKFSRITNQTESELSVDRNKYIYSTVLNKLFCSEYFERFVESLKELEDTYAKYRDMIPNLSELSDSDLNKAHLEFLMAKLSDKYGETVLELALEHCDDFFEEGDSFSLTNEERDAENEISNISSYSLDIFIRSKSDWHTIAEKSLPMLKEMYSFTNKYGEDFLKLIWSFNLKDLDLTEDQKKATNRFYYVRHQFNLFLKKGYEHLKLESLIVFDLDSLTSFLKEIELISDKYPEDVLEKAWKYHIVWKAINDINNALDENRVFLAEFKKEMGYHRFLVQESLLLLLNNIYPISVDLHNTF